VLALQNISSDETLDALEDYVHFKSEADEQADMPYALARKAIWAIAKLGTPKAVDLLRKICLDEDDKISEIARHVMERVNLI
jgi:HEAT repeat protein